MKKVIFTYDTIQNGESSEACAMILVEDAQAWALQSAFSGKDNTKASYFLRERGIGFCWRRPDDLGRRGGRSRCHAGPGNGQPYRIAEGGARFGNFDGAGGKSMSARTIYKTLAPFFEAVDASEEKTLKFTAPGYMDLCIEALGYKDHEGRPVYSVAHYGEQNGDLMRDPDVTMGVDRENGTVEPLTYQNDYIGRYWEVYKDFVDGKPTKYYPAMKKDLAAMVTAWAKNIKAQGFDPAVHA